MLPDYFKAKTMHYFGTDFSFNWKGLVLFSHQVVSDSSWPLAKLICPSPSPRVCPSTCPLNLWRHPTYLILCCPLLLLPSIFPSIRIFSNESTVLIRWPKYWSFSISPSKEYSELISFTIDWFGLLAFQGTLKSLLQHHRWKASIFQHSAFFTVQLSHLYTTGKTIAWLHGPLSAKWCLCFLTHCLGLS